MFSTIDGGVTWVPVNWGEDVNRFRFLGPKLGFASGHTIYKYSDPTTVEPSSFTRLKRRYR